MILFYSQLKSLIRSLPKHAQIIYRRAPSLRGIHAWLALMMSTKAGFKLAPPTRKPSMSACLASSLQFFSETLPPYRIRVFSEASGETSFLSHSRRAAWTSCACSVVATLPVPMALLSVSDCRCTVVGKNERTRWARKQRQSCSSP